VLTGAFSVIAKLEVAVEIFVWADHQ